MYRKILLAYDGTNYSDAVLRRGAELAALCKAELHLLSIVVPTASMAIAESFGPSDVLGFEQRELERMVGAAVLEIQGRGLAVASSVRIGDPAAAIVDYAREVEADLIVIGHEGAGALTRWLQGSVGDQLLHHLPCSLLVATDGNDRSARVAGTRGRVHAKR
jgi:nucleotide-binding universal stress UspA family protein